MLVSLLIPVKGRHDQTLALLPRLRDTAHYPQAEYIVITDGDPELAKRVRQEAPWCGLVELGTRHGYWKALAIASTIAKGELLGQLANDLLPGYQWLGRAVAAHQRRYPDGDGIIGWNDGIHTGAHAGHVLASRSLLDRWYGPGCWPTCYDHLYADTEICQRGIEEGRFAVAPWAVLYHNHPVSGLASDSVYAFSHTHQTADMNLFEARKAQGWPAL